MLSSRLISESTEIKTYIKSDCWKFVSYTGHKDLL